MPQTVHLAPAGWSKPAQFTEREMKMLKNWFARKKKKKEPQNGEEDWGNWCCVCARAETRAIIKGSSLNGQCYSSCFLVIAASRLISPQQVLRSFSAMMSIYLRGIKEMWFAFTGPEVPCRLHWNHWVLWAITILWKVWNWAFCE